jgi:hypothetical protein
MTTQSPESTNQISAHIVAPLAAMAATWAVRKLLNGGYAKATGRRAPAPDDASVSFGSALAWAAVTAASAAVVEVAVYRFVAQRQQI